MNINETFIVPNWEDFSSLWKKVSLILFGLVILLWLLGFGPGGRNCPENETSVQTSAVAVNGEDHGANTSDINNDNGFNYDVPAYSLKGDSVTAKIQFGLDSHALPKETMRSLMPTLEKMSEDDKSVAIISGYHDASGDRDYNQVLAKKRAVAVRNLLLETGLDERRLVLEKPLESVGSGDAADARRVEVSLAYLD